MESIPSEQELLQHHPILSQLKDNREILWINPNYQPVYRDAKGHHFTMAEIQEAEERLARFAPFLMTAFPETQENQGLIESPLVAIDEMRSVINQKYDSGLSGRLLLKMDSNLPIAGSVKARGGIYEVLKHTEELALTKGLIKLTDSYAKLALPENRNFFHQYTIQVGSTGNLGLSIGIISAAIGYKVVVHMSADAKTWKKDLLRQHGVTVKEYPKDYSQAVKEGRRLSNTDPNSYFVDDENSKDLFLGYAVAALRLDRQLKEAKILVDEEHPLFVYIPCGVGGAPGGITFGLKQLYGLAVHCFFVEPTQAPCMLVGMASGLEDKITVTDVGLTGQTHADGLAVGRASRMVAQAMTHLLGGIFTIRDEHLYDYLRDLHQSEGLFIEPSACAAFTGPIHLQRFLAGKEFLEKWNLTKWMEQACHIAWATGGNLVPQSERNKYLATHL